jgi:hypothetical protein
MRSQRPTPKQLITKTKNKYLHQQPLWFPSRSKLLTVLFILEIRFCSL